MVQICPLNLRGGESETPYFTVVFEGHPLNLGGSPQKEVRVFKVTKLGNFKGAPQVDATPSASPASKLVLSSNHFKGTLPEGVALWSSFSRLILNNLEGVSCTECTTDAAMALLLRLRYPSRSE